MSNPRSDLCYSDHCETEKRSIMFLTRIHLARTYGMLTLMATSEKPNRYHGNPYQPYETRVTMTTRISSSYRTLRQELSWLPGTTTICGTGSVASPRV